MTEIDLIRLAGDLAAGRVDDEEASKLAAAAPAKEPWGRQVSQLIGDALEQYLEGNMGVARAAAVVAGAASRGWSDRDRKAEGALDVRARSLAVLGFIEADLGHHEHAARLRTESDATLHKLRDPTSARFSIGATSAQREIRLGRPEEAIQLLEALLKLEKLNSNQRGATQAIYAGAMKAAGRSAEAVNQLEATAQTFDQAGRHGAALEADLERGMYLMQSGQAEVSRALLEKVARSAAATGADAVAAHARRGLGAIASKAGDHSLAGEHFRLAAAAARRVGDDANVVVGLRNAGDELRLIGDLPGAERALNEALAFGSNRAVVLDVAKAKYLLALVRHRQGRRREADQLLDDSAADFSGRLAELGPSISPGARDQIESQLQLIASLRSKISGV